MRIKCKKLLEAARGEQCTLNTVSCNFNPETVVAAHINVDGGAMGMKTDDISVCFACSDCHTWLDQHKGDYEEILFYTRRALVRTWKTLIEKGVIKL